MKRIILAIVFAIISTHAWAKVHTLQVTIGASNTAIITSGDIFFKWVAFQNNATHSMRLGDTNISTTRGMLLLAGGSYTQQPYSPPISGNLAGWFVNGTAGDVLDIIYDDGAN